MRIRYLLAALTTAALLAQPASAEEKDKELTGTFAKKASDLDLSFEFAKDKFTFKMVGPNGDGLEAEAKYTRDNDGRVTAELTNFKKLGNFNDEKEKGYKFSFKMKLEGKKLVVTDFEGEGIGQEQKDLLNGDYEKK